MARMLSALLSSIIISPISALEGPCDISKVGGTPCVAAHSLTRALYGDYDGALYTVQRLSDLKTADIKVLSPGGVAQSKDQDDFCGKDSCVVFKIIDQTGNGNDLFVAPHHVGRNGTDKPVNATRDKLTLEGFPVYSAYFEGGMGYRQDNTSLIAVGDDAESIYMVTSGVHYNNRCCFDYGNAERVPRDDGAGTMEALYFGSAKGGMNHGGIGPGPWIMADLENGLWGSNLTASVEPTISHTFITAMIKGDSGPSPGHFAVKGGDAQSGTLTVFWDGPRPHGYAPMKKQ